MMKLNTHTVVGSFSYGTQAQSTGSNVKIEIGAPSVHLAKPVSYEFRVVEHVKDGQIIKVGLQYQVWEHDNYGNGTVIQNWTDVVRMRKDVDTGEISDIIQVL